MLIYYSNYIFNALLLLSLILYACMGYAYYLNTQRAADDPKKLDIHFGVVLLAPITWPLLLIGLISLLIIKVLLFGGLLVLFTLALIVIRKPFFFAWLSKTAAWIGEQLLQANQFLLKIAFGDLLKKTQST